MKKRNWAVNVAASVALAFALSFVFWWVWDVFVLWGFIIWSLVSGIVGGGIGALVSRRVYVALAITAVIRFAVFVILSGVFF